MIPLHPEGPSYQQYNVAETGGAVYAVQDGDQYVYIYTGKPPFVIVQVPEPASVPVDMARQVPSTLLASRNEVVPFYGRQRELTWMQEWRDSNSSSFSVRLVHGPGGQGKTRLATHFAAASARAGWTVATARHSAEASVSGEGNQQFAVGKTGLLIIVDYAERWPTSDLLALLRQHHRAERSIRVLLLARPGGAWWRALVHQLGKADIQDVGSLSLAEAGVGASDRDSMYRSAFEHFSRALGDPASNPDVQNLEGPRYSLTLAVHMKALVDAHSAMRKETPPPVDELAGLSRYLLDREVEYWDTAYNNGRGPIATNGLAMAKTVYTATVTNALLHSEAVQALVQVGLNEATHASPSQVLADHLLLYPPTTSGKVLEPLYPDRLGEDYIALSTPGDDPGLAGEPWAHGLCALLLEHSISEDPPTYSRQATIVLVEVARRWPHFAERELFPLILRWPYLALMAGSTVLVQLCELESPGLIRVLEEVEEYIPAGSHLELDVGIAALSSRLVTYRLERTSDPKKRAGLLLNHCDRLHWAGLDDEALVAVQEAVRLLRDLVPTGSESGATWLADALRTSGLISFTLGRYEESLAAEQEAERILRTVAMREPSVASQLATCLEGLSGTLSELGRHEEALVAIQESLRIMPDESAGPSDLINSRTANLGTILSRLGRREEAVAATERALENFKRLAEDAPSQYLPAYALALNNLGAQLSDLGEASVAQAALEEAVRIRKRLAAINPGVYARQVPESLKNLAIQLWSLGYRDESILAVSEAAEILRTEFAGKKAIDTGIELTRTLRDKGARLWDWGRLGDAMIALEEAITVLRSIPHEAKEGAVSSEVAVLLEDVGARRWQAGKREAGLEAWTEAAELRRLIVRSTEKGLERLAKSLSGLVDMLSMSDRKSDACSVCRELVDVHRQLVDESETTRSKLAQSLQRYGKLTLELGQVQNAIDSLQEALQIREQLAVSSDSEHADEVAQCLPALGQALARAERHDDCAAALHYLVKLRRRQVTKDKSRSRDLAKALHALSGSLLASERKEDALKAAGESVELFRTIDRNDSVDLKVDLADALTSYGTALSISGDKGRALSATLEVVDIRRDLAERNPARLADLAAALNYSALELAEHSRHEDALSAVEEALRAQEKFLSDPEMLPQLALLFGSLAIRLQNLGRPEDAVSALERAVLAARLLAPFNFRHLRNLADALSGHAELLAKCGSLDDAYLRAIESVDVYRRLSDSKVEDHGRAFAESLESLGRISARLGKNQEWLACLEERTDFLRRLAYAEAATYATDFAIAINDLANARWVNGQRSEGVNAGQEAIQILRRLARAWGSDWVGRLASALSDQAVRLFLLSRSDEAISAADEAVAIYCGIESDDNSSDTAELAKSLNVCGTIRKWRGQYEEALEFVTIATDLYDALNSSAGEYTSDLRDALMEQIDLLRRLGRGEESGSLQRRVEEIADPDTDTDTGTDAEDR